MGKSNKKVKNDRINSIRKQYDAFLEEDKKRRERNEYILGKLDKMRSSTALVPISATANHHLQRNHSEIYLHPNNQITKPERDDSYVSHVDRQNITLSSFNKHGDELDILKEISKKYILIPKRRTGIENDCIYNQNVVDDDWKSKYNILDDLKRLEKETQPDPLLNQSNVNHKRYEVSKESKISYEQPPDLKNDINHIDRQISDKNNEICVSSKLNKHLEQQDDINKVNVDVSEHQDDINKVNDDVSDINNQVGDITKAPIQIAPLSNEGMNVDPTQYIHNAPQALLGNPHQEIITEEEKYNSETNEKDINLAQNFNNNLQIHEEDNSTPMEYQEHNYQPEYHISTDKTNSYKPHENVKAETINSYISEQTVSDVKPESCPENYSEETVNLNMNTGNKKVASEVQNLTSTEGMELYDDVDPESRTNTNFETHYDPAQDTIPVVIENTQNLDHVEHESEINAFEAEQKEMFYSEQAGADTFPYNQGDDNTGEYTEGYPQNDQYAYYEGVQQEQTYATNINEHEESTERYDPQYNEQYEGSYGNQQPDNPVDYESTSAYEQQQFQNENPQFENIVNYENQPENVYQQENASAENEVQENILPPQDDQMYDQHMYTVEPETQEHIEQQLITEEGYIESTPVTENAFQEGNEGHIEQVIDMITPGEPLPDRQSS